MATIDTTLHASVAVPAPGTRRAAAKAARRTAGEYLSAVFYRYIRSRIAFECDGPSRPITRRTGNGPNAMSSKAD